MEVGSVLDFMSTCCTLAGAQIPTARPIDGVNLMPALEGGKMPERPLFYYRGEHLRAVRQGRWKAHFSYWSDPSVYDEGTPNLSKYWVSPKTPMLYDLDTDPSEQFDLSAGHPDVVQQLTAVARDYTEEVQRKGENQDLIDWFRRDWAAAPRKGE
jgi:arylsulfatase A-like enzyme